MQLSNLNPYKLFARSLQFGLMVRINAGYLLVGLSLKVGILAAIAIRAYQGIPYQDMLNKQLDLLPFLFIYWISTWYLVEYEILDDLHYRTKRAAAELLVEKDMENQRLEKELSRYTEQQELNKPAV